MKPLIFLDTETTGLTEARLVELAYKVQDKLAVVLRCKPPKKIEIGATMVNHITNKMVKDLPLFKDHDDYKQIKEELEGGIIVAHHASYDIEVLAREGIYISEYIDTKEMAQSHFKKAEMFRLQYLRYYLEMEIDAEAHTAGGDLLVLEELWNRMASGFEQETIEKWRRAIEVPK